MAKDEVMTKPLRYFLRGIIADVIILAGIVIFVLVDIALSYRGRCGVFWFFGGAGHPCSRSEYVKEEAAFFFIALVGTPEAWLLILPALSIIPLLSYLLGRLKAQV
jgi:hypothetical protein